MSEPEIQALSPEEKPDLFGVIAEMDGRSKPMVLLDLPFSRLIDDVIKPYDQDEPFFIDGVPLSKTKVTRIKIVRFGQWYKRKVAELELGLTRGDHQAQKIYGDQYEVRFEHIVRTNSEDVTSQVIKAYNQAVKPNITEYLPKREELISAAIQLFVQGMKALAT